MPICVHINNSRAFVVILAAIYKYSIAHIAEMCAIEFAFKMFNKINETHIYVCIYV